MFKKGEMEIQPIPYEVTLNPLTNVITWVILGRNIEENNEALLEVIRSILIN